MNKKDTVVFDLDGTLLDTLEDLKNSVNYAMTQCGYPEHTLDEVRRYVGNGILLLMQRAIPGGKDDPNFDKAFTLFKEHYGKHCNDTTKPYAGIMELLHTLKENNIKIAIVSNKADFAVKELNAIYFKDLILVARKRRHPKEASTRYGNRSIETARKHCRKLRLYRRLRCRY